MILYLYYLGEVIEGSTNSQRKKYEPHREYLSYHYWKVAVKTYKLFRIVRPKQIFRTSRTFTVTTVGDLTLDEINAIEGIFNVYQVETNYNEFKDLINIESFEQQSKEFQPEVETKKGRVLRQSPTPEIDHVIRSCDTRYLTHDIIM